MCILDWFALTPCLHGMSFCGRRPVGLSGTVSLISLAWYSWAALYAIYIGSLDIILFWLFWSHSLVGSSLQLAHWESLYPPCLLYCCTGAARTKLNSPGNKPMSAKIAPNDNHTVKSKWTNISKYAKNVKTIIRKGKHMLND